VSAKRVAVMSVVVALVVGAAFVSAPAGAQSGSGKKTLHVIGAFETKGDSAQAIPHYDDGAKLGAKDLERKGWTVTYERIPASGTIASSQEQAFLSAQAKNPDVYMALPSSNVFIPVGPKIAATDLPTFGLSSPTEGVKTGISGGDNIFLLRPLNEAVYAKIVEYACVDLKLKKLGLSVVSTALGATATQVARREAAKHKNCEIVSEQPNSAVATDLTQQVLAFKNAGVDGIVAANFPNPTGVLINQARQNGVTVPILGNTSTNIVKDANALQSTADLYVFDDCTPDLNKDKQSKQFVKAYQAEYGYPANYASAQLYDAMHMAAAAVDQGGHDPVKITKALAGMQYDGVCDFANDKNNAMARSLTVFTYDASGGKKLLGRVPLAFVPNDELVVVTTTTAPPAG
jgi:branched-chain amino acid transport system substrate-binding protein